MNKTDYNRILEKTKLTRSGFKVMGINKNVSHEKRIYLIKRLLALGVTIKGIKAMNGTDQEIHEALK